MGGFPVDSDPARPVRIAEAPHAKTVQQPTKCIVVSHGNWSDIEETEIKGIEDALLDLEAAMQDLASLTSQHASKRVLSDVDRQKLVSARDLLDQAKKTELGRAEILRAGAVIAGNASIDAEATVFGIQAKLGGFTQELDDITKELAAAKKESLKELEVAGRPSLKELEVAKEKLEAEKSKLLKESPDAKRESLAKARTFKAAAKKEVAAWKDLAAHKHPKDKVIAEFFRRAHNDVCEADVSIKNSEHPEKLLDP